MRALSVAFPLALAALSGAQSRAYDRLVVERSPMQLRASAAIYAGVEQESMSPESLERSRRLQDWYEARSGETIFFSAHLSSVSSEEGLGEYRPGAPTWRRYPMFALAVAAGWYRPALEENSFPEFIRGVAVGGGRVWMGSAGVGVVARNLRDGTWSRYDLKRDILPGIHIFVLHADDKYVLVMSGGPTGGWNERLPDARESDLGPALEVYSLRRDAWLRVRAIPRTNVVSFGWTQVMAQLTCDTRPLAEAVIVPVGLCTMPDRAAPTENGYMFSYEFAKPGEPMRFVITESQIESAFDSLR